MFTFRRIGTQKTFSARMLRQDQGAYHVYEEGYGYRILSKLEYEIVR